MKITGFLLLLAGCALAVSAVALLSKPASRAAFVFCGLAVQALGLVFAFRSHLSLRGER